MANGWFQRKFELTRRRVGIKSKCWPLGSGLDVTGIYPARPSHFRPVIRLFLFGQMLVERHTYSTRS